LHSWSSECRQFIFSMGGFVPPGFLGFIGIRRGGLGLEYIDSRG
jgi:hypothetical protein